MKQIQIREYQEGDWKDICHIHDQARPLEVQNFIPKDVIERDKSLTMEKAVVVAGAFFESDIFVATDEHDKIVGFIGVQDDELTWMFVNPNCHRQGVGSRLVGHIRSQLGPNGYVLCAQENKAGFNFYKAVGFEPIAFFSRSRTRLSMYLRPHDLSG